MDWTDCNCSLILTINVDADSSQSIQLLLNTEMKLKSSISRFLTKLRFLENFWRTSVFFGGH